MLSTIDEIELAITEAISPGFRGQLINRGKARSMIWKDAILPDDAPKFSPELSYDLLSYGYSLLSMGIRLRELKGNEEIYRAALSKAASAIETVIFKGDPKDTAYGFHNIIAASAYHLSRYSAKAYSLFKNTRSERNLNHIEKTLCMVILRRFDELEKVILAWKIDGKGSDENLASNIDLDINKINLDLEFNVVNTAITDNYYSAISLFLMALEYGDKQLLNESICLLRANLEVCNKFSLVPQWWIHRLTIHFLDDLWSCSFHEILLAEDDEKMGDWWLLRWYFIASLYKRKKAEIELWPSQIAGAKRAMNQKDDLVVCLPTSAGKTRIGEICILKCLSQGKRVIFITPLRALSAQTESSLRKTFSPLGKTVSTLYGSIGISDFEQDTLRTKDIIVGTPEKLDFALRNDPSLIDDVGLVVLDEGHMIGLNEREIRYEVQVQRLLKRLDADQRRIVCLSAILPDGEQLNDFVEWLRRDKEGGPVKDNWRPTDLLFGEVMWNKENKSAILNFRIGDEHPFIPAFIKGVVPPIGKRGLHFPKNSQELSLATAWKLIEDGHSVLIYCPLKLSVESFAKIIVDLHNRGALISVLDVSKDKLKLALALGREWLGDDHPILECLKIGVAIHYGALPTPFRKEMEKLLHERIIKLTISSPTLAQGINLSATAIVVHSLFRNGEVIQASEFKNVIGRAGRAFVDTQGIVLHPMFDDHYKRKNKWENLIKDTKSKNIESGLFQLISLLLERMCKHIKAKSLDDVIQYVTNNANNLAFPDIDDESEEVKNNAMKIWYEQIAILDTAILSLIGENECNENDIPHAIDNILNGSLWQRCLLRKSDEMQLLMNRIILSRASYIWRNSSSQQRKGYFLAGIGLDSGKKLDAVATEVNKLLVVANYYISIKNSDKAILTITNLADIIFTIKPFTPKTVPVNWKDILAAWLKGESLASDNHDVMNDILEFVENGLIFLLPWGLEAIRVRAEANSEEIVEGMTIVDYETNLVVPAVENGSLNVSASLLMQAGFNSRLAAIKAVNDGDGIFTSSLELAKWLQSPQIVALTDGLNWPTPETSHMWLEFVGNFHAKLTQTWKTHESKISVSWLNNKNKLKYQDKVRLMNHADKTMILSLTGDVLGHASFCVNLLENGIYYASVSDKDGFLDVIFIGSGTDPFAMKNHAK